MSSPGQEPVPSSLVWSAVVWSTLRDTLLSVSTTPGWWSRLDWFKLRLVNYDHRENTSCHPHCEEPPYHNVFFLSFWLLQLFHSFHMKVGPPRVDLFYNWLQLNRADKHKYISIRPQCQQYQIRQPQMLRLCDFMCNRAAKAFTFVNH